MMIPTRQWLVACLLAVAAACGGGGKTTGDSDAHPGGHTLADAGGGARLTDAGSARLTDAGGGGQPMDAGDASHPVDAGSSDHVMDAAASAGATDASGGQLMDTGGQSTDASGGPLIDATSHEAAVDDDASVADAAVWPNPIAEENAKPGSTSWPLTNPATSHEIEGYASVTSVNLGESIDLYVSTSSPSYAVEIYRLGWYGGAGARLIVPEQIRTGIAQTLPVPDADGLVECHWIRPLAVATQPSWVSGVYLAKLTASATNKQAYIPFVVRNDARAADYLFQSSVTTFQAYNNWGGKSLYDFNSDGQRRAYKVSFHRPYAPGPNPEAAAGVGAGEILTTMQAGTEAPAAGWEYSMIRFLEREAVDVSYVTSIDTHRNAELLRSHKAFFSVGHDEYWSWEMRRTVEDGRDRFGTSVGFFSGNVAYWQIRLEPESGPDAFSRVVCYKDAPPGDPVIGTQDEYRTTVRWSWPPLSRPEAALDGLAFRDFGVHADMVVADPDHWIFAGTGLARGDHLAGLVGYEVDGSSNPPSAGLLRFARSPWSTSRGSGVSDMVSFTTSSGADVVALGSIQFAWGLDDFRAAGVVGTAPASAAARTMARNVLARFAEPRRPPARSSVVLDETFGAPRDPAGWRLATLTEGPGAYDPAVSVAQVGGQLEVSLLDGASGFHHGGYVSARTIDLGGTAVQVEVVQTASTATAADTTFAIGFDPGNFYRFTVESHSLVLQRTNAGNTSSQSLAYDATAQRFWRFRHDALTNSIVWETSQDGRAWTARRSEGVTVPLSALFVELEAGTYQAEIAPGVAIFDNLRVELLGMTDGFEASRNPEHFMPELFGVGGAYNPLVRVFPFGGRLHIRPLPATLIANFGGYASTHEWDLTGASVSVEAVQVVTGRATIELSITKSENESVGIAVEDGILTSLEQTPAGFNAALAPYDPVADRFWRIRHYPGANEIVWETSPDGSVWTERRRAPSPFDVRSARVQLFAGTNESQAAPVEALFDNFALTR